MNHISEKSVRPGQELIGRSFFWSAPSNIALVKYWGKKPGVQIPTNPSISLTLDHARTSAKLIVSGEFDEDQWIQLKFEGQDMPAFLPKIEKFFNYVSQYFPSIKDFSYKLETQNTFPHSAGIASSASSMAAMALCLVELEQEVSAKKYSESEFLARSSFFARLGSGSACRSLYPACASWGIHKSGGSDETATVVEVHPIFQTMKDSVILVDQSEKKVSSRAGHGLMQGHLFGSARTSQANDNWSLAHKWLQDGSWDMLGSLVEEEALTLHAMMMTSRPGYILMKPDSLKIIEEVKLFRTKTKIPLYFTLDAGPNVHLLYPQKDSDSVISFIDRICTSEGKSLSVMHDCVGNGPRKESDKLEGL